MLRASLAVLLCATSAASADVPATLPPGVLYSCADHHRLTDASGSVSFANTEQEHTVCWQIACDKDVVVTFSADIELSYWSFMVMYSSGNTTDSFRLETSFNAPNYDTSPIMLSGSAVVQFRGGRNAGRSAFEFSYMCVDATSPAPATDVPDTLVPGVVRACVGGHTDLTDSAGHVSFVNTEEFARNTCWHIACDTKAVLSFTAMDLQLQSTLYLYGSGNAGDYTLERSLEVSTQFTGDVVLNGSALVQYAPGFYTGSVLEFSYVCMDVGDPTPAPPTALPATRAPGVGSVCKGHTDLNDTAGNVSFANSEKDHTECWHIACDKDVVLSFSDVWLSFYSDVYLYSSHDAADFHLERTLSSSFSGGDVDVVLSGSAFVQFRSGFASYGGLNFSYVCVDAPPTPMPPTDVPATPTPPVTVPGLWYACDEYTELDGSSAGNTSAVALKKQWHSQCFHIDCDKEVVLTFSEVQLDMGAYVYLYNTGEDAVGNATEYSVFSWTRPTVGSDIVLSGSTIVQLRTGNPHHWLTSAIAFDYVCVDAATPQPPSAAPATSAPGVGQVCDSIVELGDNNSAGNVSFVDGGVFTACWHLTCDKEVTITVLRPDPTLVLFPTGTLKLYSAASGMDYNLERTFSRGDDVRYATVLAGSAFVVLSNTNFRFQMGVDFDYVCGATTPAPPTAEPNTLAPGVHYVCEEQHDLGDNETGNVSFQNYDKDHTECWHIECDKEVVISFSNLQLSEYSYLHLYTSGNESGNGTDFDWHRSYNSNSGTPDSNIVLNGSAFVQFRSTYSDGWSRVEFNYVCVNDATPAPPTDAPGTRAPATSVPITPTTPRTTAPDTVAPLTPAPRTVAPTPETSTPGVPTTNAPLTVEDVDWCDVDADCRTYDDSAATCVESKCVCTESAGFVNPVTKKTKETLFICVQPTKRGKVKLRLEWNVDCEQSNGAIEGAVRTAIEETTKGRTDTLAVSCGSTIFVVDVEDADITTVATEDMSELIVASLKKNEAAVAAGFATPMTVGSSVVPTLKCSAAGATEMVLVNGGCVALACESGYLLSSGSCVEDDDSDDTLSTGAIVGIVLGCSAFVVIIIAVAAFFLCKGSKAKDTVCHPTPHFHSLSTTTFLSESHRTCL